MHTLKSEKHGTKLQLNQNCRTKIWIQSWLFAKPFFYYMASPLKVFFFNNCNCHVILTTTMWSKLKYSSLFNRWKNWSIEIICPFLRHRESDIKTWTRFQQVISDSMMYFLKNVFVTLKDFFFLNTGWHIIPSSHFPRFLQHYSISCRVAEGVVRGRIQLWNTLCHKSQLLLTRSSSANPRRTSLRQHSICRALPGQCQSRVERNARKCWRYDRKAI